MKTLIARIITGALLVLLLASCAPAAAPAATQPPQATVDIGAINTAAVQTYVVESTRNAMLIPTSTEVILPTNTPEPPTATATVAQVVNTPANQPTLWIPPSGSSYPSITASLNTNCRSGPDKFFDVVGALRVGDTSEVHGKLNGGGWWYIKNVTNPDPKYCWVWAETTVVTGDTSNLPVVQAPVAHPPKLTLSISAAPPTSAVCPTTFVFTATVASDRAADLAYQIVDADGKVLKAGEMVFTDDGSQSVSVSKSYSKNISSWVMLEITYPFADHSSKAVFTQTCP